MRVLRLLRRRAPGIAALAIAGGIVSGLSNTGLVALLGQVLSARGAARWDLGWKYLALLLVAPLANVAAGFLLIRLGQNTVRDLRLDLSARILGAPLGQLEKVGAHRLVATLTSDVAAISEGFTEIPALAINMTIVVGTLGYLAWLSPRLCLFLLAGIAVGILSYQIPVAAAERRIRDARREVDALYGHFRALTQGTKELKMHDPRRAAFLGELEATAETFRTLSISAATIYRAVSAWGGMLVFVVAFLLVFVAARLVGAPPGAVAASTLALFYLATPLQGLLGSLPALGRAQVALDAIESLGLDTEAEDGSPAAEPARSAPRPLRLIDVRHSYVDPADQSSFTLGPISLEIEPGSILFLVGGNGSGKTTLAKILVGLYPPESGEIWLDGAAVREGDEGRLRQLFSAVFADFFVFDRLLGLDGDDLDRRAAALLDELQLSHKLSIERGRLSTSALSQGQRKRLALMTALLEDRPFYLFDEWAADQDPVFKEIFYRRLLPQLKERGKTVVVISHDDRYFELADLLVKLDSGKLIALTRRRELVASG